MKIISQNDIHLRSTRPINRTDDYIRAQVSKFSQLLDWSKTYDAPILCGGDLCDAPNTGFKIYNQIVELLQRFDVSLYTCVGNHDPYFHNLSTLKDTTLYAFGQVEGVEIVKGQIELGPQVVLTSVDWEGEPDDPIPGMFNIFLAHVSVFEDEIPFYWKGEGYTAKSITKRYPGFDLYLCGDIHIPFVRGNVVVSGSMMRQNIDQRDYKPRAYMIDTDTMKIEPLYYGIEHDVFTVGNVSVENNLDLTGLVDALSEASTGKAEYKQDCLTLSKGDKPVQTIIKETLDDVS